MTTRILLVDDHEIVRVGLRAVLASEEHLEVVGEASDGPGAIDMAVALQPSVVVLDVRLGEEMDGIEACRAIKQQLPATAVLILTSFASDRAVMAALVAGASGFLVKNTGRAEFVQAVRALAAGKSLLDPTVTRRVIDRLVSAAQLGPAELASLSPREREVIARLAHGDTNRQIAERLVISEATARHHVSSVLEKLGLSRRTEAAALAARLQLDDPTE